MRSGEGGRAHSNSFWVIIFYPSQLRTLDNRGRAIAFVSKEMIARSTEALMALIVTYTFGSWDLNMQQRPVEMHQQQT